MILRNSFQANDRSAADYFADAVVYPVMHSSILMSWSVLDTLPMGLVFLTADGRTVYANRAAEEIFRSSDGLFFQNGTICASDRRADADLRELIRQALAPILAPNIAAIQVPRHSLRRAYQCVAPPFRKRLPQFLDPTPESGTSFPA